MKSFFYKLSQLRFYRDDNGLRLLKFLGQNKKTSQLINFSINLAWRLFVTFNNKKIDSKISTGNRLNSNCKKSGRDLFSKKIVIIAELSISQCKKYRVTQKVEMLENLGFIVEVCAWHETERAITMLQTAGEVIFYRVPAFPNVLKVINEAKRLGLKIGYDIDDLVFCEETLRTNKSLAGLAEQERIEIFNGAKLYREALSAADYGIASTHTIAQAMQQLGINKSAIVENALDKTILKLAQEIIPSPKQIDIVTIGYGSGTKTHDADFKIATSALKKVLKKYPQARLVIYGLLNTEDFFEEVSEQVWRVDLLNADDYYRALASFDISIAPLEKNIFNDAKSNIKWIEASIFGVPSVCSPAAAFNNAITQGINGFLAENDNEWYEYLATLVEHPELRKKMGEQAKLYALENYHHDVIAKRSLATIFPPVTNNQFRILLVNLLFTPQSFGGATIVVENLAHWLATQNHIEVLVFTGNWDSNQPFFAQTRYEVGNISVVKVNLPPTLSDTEHYHAELGNHFSQLLTAWQPNVVHFHAIQHLGGAALLEACNAATIPFAVTLHDAWWLCARQFQLTSEQKFCGQETIYLARCASCTQNSGLTHRRAYTLREALIKAQLWLAPSEFQRQFYAANGFSDSRLRLNKNGVLPPATSYTRSHNVLKKTRFAYLGGRAVHKGYSILEKTFAQLPHDSWHLTLVNIEAHLGKNPFYQDQWTQQKNVTVIPPFACTTTQLDDFFSQIDVLLFPSQARESFGLAVREALIRDVWVICSDAGGAAEDIIDGVNGNVVRVGDTTAFYTAVTQQLTSQTTKQPYANPYRTKIRTVDEQAAELLCYLQEIAHVST